MDLHIDDFYKDAASGLTLLYQAFPRKVAVYIEDLIGREEPDEFGLPSKRHQACLSALLWLADEGYLRYESSIAYDALDQACLTHKGFTRMSQPEPNPLIEHSDLPPSVRRVHATLAFQLREALNQGHGERIASLTRSLLKPCRKATDDTV